MYTLKGEIEFIDETKQVSESFTKREFVVLDPSGQYAQSIKFQLIQDRCKLLDSIRLGDLVEVTFFLRGRKWVNPKDDSISYFNTLDAWKIVTSKANTDHVIPHTTNSNSPETKENQTSDLIPDGDDDLPF